MGEIKPESTGILMDFCCRVPIITSVTRDILIYNQKHLVHATFFT